MFDNINETLLIEDIKNVLKTSNLHPEPQHRALRQYVANTDSNPDNTICNIINSQGIQIKNNVAFYKELGCKKKLELCPVLDVDHLSPVEDWKEFKKKLKNLPSEWTLVHIGTTFNPCKIIQPESSNNVHCLITRVPCGKTIERDEVLVKPICFNGDGFLESIKQLITRRTSSERHLKGVKVNFDMSMQDLVSDFNTFIMETAKCMFVGRIEDNTLHAATMDKLTELLNDFTEEYNKEGFQPWLSNVCYTLILGAHHMKNKNMMEMLRPGVNPQVTDTRLFYFIEKLKKLNLMNDGALQKAAKHPVILIMDHELEIIPWEMLPMLYGEPVTRVSSFNLLYAMFKYHEQYIKDGYRMCNLGSAFCFVNPGQDLKTCEDIMKELLQTTLCYATSVVGVKGDATLLLRLIHEKDVYVYCGHGSGTQYLSSSKLRTTTLQGLVMLFGCSSNLPRDSGGRTPIQNDTYTYLVNGSPCIIGFVYPITTCDSDKASVKILADMMPTINNVGAVKKVEAPKEPNILHAVVQGRDSCSRYWTRCALVVRGLPCKLDFTEADKCKMLDSLS